MSKPNRYQNRVQRSLELYPWLQHDPVDPNYLICSVHFKRNDYKYRAPGRWTKFSLHIQRLKKHHNDYHASTTEENDPSTPVPPQDSILPNTSSPIQPDTRLTLDPPSTDQVKALNELIEWGKNNPIISNMNPVDTSSDNQKKRKSDHLEDRKLKGSKLFDEIYSEYEDLKERKIETMLEIFSLQKAMNESNSKVTETKIILTQQIIEQSQLHKDLTQAKERFDTLQGKLTNHSISKFIE
jgi:uncharacterized protein YfbU (UPF0304 family)